MSNERIEAFWVNATAFEVARVMNGETVEARFRDSETMPWSVNSFNLKGWAEGSWVCNEGLGWVNCQVYREPSWYTDKPDPGPGWRLLEKFPDEDPKSEDDWFNPESKIWSPSVRACRGERQSEGIWYRRRIEAVEDPAGDWEPTDEEFQYAQDLCRVPKGTHDPVEFRKFVDKAQAGELSFTCSFVWEGPRAKVGDRIQHPNGCWLEIIESGFKIEAALNTIEFTG
jgi:hypothetical protein